MQTDNPTPEAAPIALRHGGWFVMDDGPMGWSGPWKTENAAIAARAGEYEEAHQLERTAQ